MKNNWIRYALILMVVIILLFTVIFVCKDIKENKTEVTSNIVYNKLSEENYTINKNTNEIIFSGDVKIGSFCISENPEGPTKEDKWILTDGEKVIKLEDESGESIRKKVYIYYTAGLVSSLTNFNSSADIYVIRNESELKEFATKVNSGTTFAGKTVYLLSDITLSGTSNNHTPIGTATCPFKGTFDGNGYAISNININNAWLDNAGLFGYIDKATIKNITVNGTGIYGRYYVGGIVGQSVNNGTVENCINNISISGANCVGGISRTFCRNFKKL